MVDVEYRRGKNSFQRELDSKLRDRKSRGLSADMSDDESDDDGLGSDDDLLAHFNATSRFSNRPGSAKQRGSPTAGMRGSPALGARDSPLGIRESSSLGSRESPVLGSRGSPSVGSRGTPGLDSSLGRSSGMTAEEILKHRQQATPPPKPQPRKGASPQPEKPLTKEDIIFGGRQAKKDASELPFREEKKQWQPPSFLRNSPLHNEEAKASPRPDDRKLGGDLAPLAPLRSPRQPEQRSRDMFDGRQSPERARQIPDRARESPELRNRSSPVDGRRSAEEEKENRRGGLRKQKTIQESPEPKSRFVKPKEEKPKPEPRSRASSAGSEVFKKTERSTPSYLVEESDSEDSADEFLRKVKEHKVTLSGRATPDRDGRRTPGKDSGRQTPVEDRKSPSPDKKKSSLTGRKSPLDGRKSPLDGRKSPSDGRKSPNKKSGKDDEEEETRRKSVYDMLVGDEEEDKKKKKEKKKEPTRETPSPAPRRRPASATSSDRGRSPSPVKPRPSSRSRDEDFMSRKAPPAEESSVCDDVEEDPMRKKIEQEGSGDAPRRRKGSRKQTSDRQTADDVIGQVADLNEKETRTMQYIEPDGESQQKKEKKVESKKDPKIVRPKARYAVPSVTEPRPESARSYSSTSEIRDSIYQDWYKERMRKAKEEAKRRKQQEKEEKERKEKEKNDKIMENKLAFDSWNKSKENWVKNKVKEKKHKDVEEEEKIKEKMEKQKDAEMAFKTWKESKDSKIQEQVRKKKREEEKKKEEEYEKKTSRKNESVEFFESWKKKKDEVLVNTHQSKKEAEKEKKRKEEEERREKEEEAKQSYERWLENSERRQHRMTLRMSQSMENLNTRPAWSPAKTLISTKNCRIK